MKRIVVIQLMILATLVFSALQVHRPAYAAGLEARIEVDESFSPGEEISFRYTISVAKEAAISFAASVLCPDAPIPLLELQQATVIPGQPVTRMYTYTTVDNSILPQTCTAVLSILTPEEVTVEEEFDVTGTQSLQLVVKSCRDVSCEHPAQVFVAGERVYLDFTASEDGVSVSAIMLLPDGTEQILTLPEDVTPDFEGTYTVTAGAEKSGFLPGSSELQFGVIVERLEVGDEDAAASGDGDSSGVTGPVGEMDAWFEGQISDSNLRTVVLIAAVAAGVIAVVGVVLLARRSKRGVISSPKNSKGDHR